MGRGGETESEKCERARKVASPPWTQVLARCYCETGTPLRQIFYICHSNADAPLNAPCRRNWKTRPRNAVVFR